MPIDDLFDDLRVKEREADIIKAKLANENAIIFYEAEKCFKKGKEIRKLQAAKSKYSIDEFIDEVTNGYGFTDPEYGEYVFPDGKVIKSLDGDISPAANAYASIILGDIEIHDKNDELGLQLHLGYLKARLTKDLSILGYMSDIGSIRSRLKNKEFFKAKNGISTTKSWLDKLIPNKSKGLETADQVNSAIEIVRVRSHDIAIYNDVKKLSKEYNLDPNIIAIITKNPQFYRPQFSEVLKDNIDCFLINSTIAFMVGMGEKYIFHMKYVGNPLINAACSTTVYNALYLGNKKNFNRVLKRSPGGFLGYALGWSLASLL